MRHLLMMIAAVATAVVLTSTVCHAKQKPPVVTQRDLEDNSCGAAKKADAELNKIYQKVLLHYKNDKNFIEKLKKAQRAWISFRDAHIASVYPAEDKNLNYGSVYGMCYCGLREQLTVERTKVLKQWLDGLMEGEVCVGSMAPDREQ